MNNKDKYEALKEMLSDNVSYIELVRLVSGELKEIGDAILDGKRIFYRGNAIPIETMRFNDAWSCYTLDEDDFEAVTMLVEGRSYWVVSLEHEQFCYEFNPTLSNFNHTITPLNRGLIFNTQRAAVEHAKELLRLS